MFYFPFTIISNSMNNKMKKLIKNYNKDTKEEYKTLITNLFFFKIANVYEFDKFEQRLNQKDRIGILNGFTKHTFVVTTDINCNCNNLNIIAVFCDREDALKYIKEFEKELVIFEYCSDVIVQMNYMGYWVSKVPCSISHENK
jgi:hypothetical protein